MNDSFAVAKLIKMSKEFKSMTLAVECVKTAYAIGVSKTKKNRRECQLRSPPIYAEVLAKNQGRKEDATAEFCIEVACWLADLKKWAINTLHMGRDPQAAVEQLVKTLDKIEYYLPTSELKTKQRE